MKFSRSKKFFVGFFLSVSFLFLLTVPCIGADKYGFEKTAGGTKLISMSLSSSSPESLARDIVQKALFFVGTIFFLLILYAGFIWMTARGQSQRVDTAKQILETAIIGLVIVSASYAISTFVFNRLTSPVETNQQGVVTTST